MPLYVYYVCHFCNSWPFEPDFASLNYSMSRLRISNKSVWNSEIQIRGYAPKHLNYACLVVNTILCQRTNPMRTHGVRTREFLRMRIGGNAPSTETIIADDKIQ